MQPKPFISLYIVFAIICFIGCVAKEQQYSKIWFYTYSSSRSGTPGTLTPVSFLNLQPDGNYTRDFNRFDFGTWKLAGKDIQLTNHKNQTETIPVSYFSGKELKIGTNAAIDNFEAAPSIFKNTDQNPFSQKSNLWRISATHKESDAEIKARVLNHLKFWEQYFTWAYDNEIKTIDVRSTPTLIKVYGNGFTLKPLHALPKEWKAYFFDEEDCGKANNLIEDIFKNENIAWPHTENKYKMFISGFQQLQKKLARRQA